MATQHTLEMQQSLPVAALAGCWKLEAGRATTLQPHQAGVFRVAHGSVWVTFDGPHRGAGNELGDHVLRAGEQLQVLPGQRVVVEPWFIGAIDKAAPPAYFAWEPLGQTAASGARSALDTNAQWQGGVVRPVHELAMALALASRALGRLVLGLGGWTGCLLGARSNRPAALRV